MRMANGRTANVKVVVNISAFSFHFIFFPHSRFPQCLLRVSAAAVATNENFALPNCKPQAATAAVALKQIWLKVALPTRSTLLNYQLN